MKRTFDVVVSALGLIVLMPVILIIAYFISRSSAGGLFVQARIGKFGNPFQCYKFRTMAHGAPVAGG
jgi:O-antigen biosynthesis protein WbqP